MRFSFFRPLTPPVKFCTSMAASMQERGSKRGLAAYKRRASGEKSALRAACVDLPPDGVPFRTVRGQTGAPPSTFLLKLSV